MPRKSIVEIQFCQVICWAMLKHPNHSAFLPALPEDTAGLAEGLKGKGETKDITLLIIWRPPGPPGVSKDVQLYTKLGFGSLVL